MNGSVHVKRIYRLGKIQAAHQHAPEAAAFRRINKTEAKDWVDEPIAGLLLAAQIFPQIQEFRYARIFQQGFGREFMALIIQGSFRFYLVRYNALVGERPYLAFQLSRIPTLPLRFFQVERPRLRLMHAHDCPMMRPSQFDTQCVSNLRFGRIRLVKKATIPQMRLAKPVAEFGRQLAGYSLQQPLAIRGPLAPLLLLHDDSPPYQPVRKRHRGVDVSNNTPPCKDNDIPYVADTVPRHRHCCRNFGHLHLLTFHGIPAYYTKIFAVSPLMRYVHV